MHGSFLCASLEIGMLRRALMYVCELRQAKPRGLGSPHTTSPDPNLLSSTLRPRAYGADSGSNIAGADLSQTAARRYSGEGTEAQWAGRVSEETTGMQAKPVSSAAGKHKRNLTIQVFLHCARIDVSPPISSCTHICILPAHTYASWLEPSHLPQRRHLLSCPMRCT